MIDAYARSGVVPYKMDEDLYEAIRNNIEEDSKLLRVRPFPENNGIQSSEELWQAMYDLRSKFGLFNTSKRLGFEMWFNEGAIQFFFYVEDEIQEEQLRRQIDAHYPNAQIVDGGFKFPDIYKDDWVAGAELELKESEYYPIKNPNGVRQFPSDPYRSITSDMIAAESDRVIIQVTTRPAMNTWTHGGKLGYINPFAEDIFEVADNLKDQQRIPDGSTKEYRAPTSEERQLAENIARQEGRPAFHINIRIFSFSPQKQTVKNNIESIARTYEQSFQEAGGQRFLRRGLGGTELKRMLKEASSRRVVDQDMIFTIPELATIAHVPNDSIETPAVDWNNTQATARIPAAAERYEDNAGHSEGQFSPEDLQPPENNEEEIPGVETPLDIPGDEQPPEEQLPEEPPHQTHENEQSPQKPMTDNNDPFDDETEEKTESFNEPPQQGETQPHEKEQPHGQPPHQPQNRGQQQPQEHVGQPPQQSGTPSHNDQDEYTFVEEDDPDVLTRVKRFFGFEKKRGFQDENEQEPPQHNPGQQPPQQPREQPPQPKDPSERPSQKPGQQPPQQPGRRSSQPTNGYPDEGGSQARRPQGQSQSDKDYVDDPNQPQYGTEEIGRETVWGNGGDYVEDPDEEPTIEDVNEEFEQQREDAWEFEPDEEPDDSNPK